MISCTAEHRSSKESFLVGISGGEERRKLWEMGGMKLGIRRFKGLGKERVLEEQGE